jgi:beta-glucosidase
MTAAGDREARIDKAIAALDLAAKVRLLTGAAMFSLWPEPAVGLTELRLSDGPTGVRGDTFTGGDIACLLPNATLLAQTWNADVAGEAGALLADEARIRRVHVVLGPTINLHRTPLGGRLFEAYSEDPLLTGVLASAYVRAMQAAGIAATPKHFLANESEIARTTVDSVIDEKTLREVYLLPFEMAVREARAWAVMASYNRINGVPATEHGELVDGVLKGEWGYDGLVMSDWFATTSTAASANGGLDLVMPGPAGPWGEALVAAVRAGEVAEPTVDEHLRRLLRLADRVGAFTGTERAWPTDLPAPDSPPRRDQLRRMAASGMTVLVNRDGTLPLAAGTRVVLVGRHAIETVGQGGGSARVHAPHVVSVADAMTQAFPDLSVVDGVSVRVGPVPPVPGTLRDPETGAAGLRVVTRDAAGAVLASRYVDTVEVTHGFGGWIDEAATIELSADVAIAAPATMRIGVRGLGDWTFTAPGREWTARLSAPDEPGAGLLKPPFSTNDVDLAPGARLTATVRNVAGQSFLGLVAMPAGRPAADVIADAARAVEDAELAVVVVGLTQEQETEGTDKATLTLPGEQDAMVTAVAAVARRTVVVVNAATPVLMPWLDQVDAVLWAGLPGQEAGAAVVAALLGEIEPAGRLVTTFPAADGQGPAWSTVPVRGALPYTERTALGYRGWYGTGEPLFWFGHGLGYTTWTYTGGEVTVADGIVASVRVALANAGGRAGREVVQVYLRPADPAEPVRLIGWAGVSLQPGAAGVVDVMCDGRAQRVWDGGWRPLPGAEVLVARGLGDIRLRLPVT